MSSYSLRWLNLAPPAALVLNCTPSQAAQYLTITEAQKLMFPEATAFDSVPLSLNDNQKSEIERLSDVRVREIALKFWKVKSSKGPLGFFVVDDVLGKHEYITYAIAIRPDKSVRSIEILQYLETYGSEVRNEAWRKQFVGKKASAPLKLEQDIQNISGATLSCRHVTDGVKRILQTIEVVFKNV